MSVPPIPAERLREIFDKPRPHLRLVEPVKPNLYAQLESESEGLEEMLAEWRADLGIIGYGLAAASAVIIIFRLSQLGVL